MLKLITGMLSGSDFLIPGVHLEKLHLMLKVFEMEPTSFVFLALFRRNKLGILAVLLELKEKNNNKGRF